MKANLILFSFIVLQTMLVSCSEINLYEEESRDKVVDLKEVDYYLPDRSGRELVIRHCMICHSLKYIQMQPDLPRKAWEKTVDKMINTFGAPVPDSLTAKKIVDYLATMRN